MSQNNRHFGSHQKSYRSRVNGADIASPTHTAWTRKWAERIASQNGLKGEVL